MGCTRQFLKQAKRLVCLRSSPTATNWRLLREGGEPRLTVEDEKLGKKKLQKPRRDNANLDEK
jgi:hypothetical protein